MNVGTQDRPLPRWRRVSLPLLLGTVVIGILYPGKEGDGLPGLLLPSIPLAFLLVGTMDLLLRFLDTSRWGGRCPRPHDCLPSRYWMILITAFAVTVIFFIILPFCVQVVLPDYSWPLDRCIKTHDLDRLKDLLARDPGLVHSPVAPRIGAGWTTQDWEPIHLAAWIGNIGAADLLLEAGAGVNSLGLVGNAPPPLTVAAREGQIDMVHWLIRHGADVNASDWSGLHPLHAAARAGNLPVCETLLEQGADINAREDFTGKTPLDYATRGVGRTLRQRGALGGMSLCPTLHLMARNGWIDCVRELLSNGADPHLRNSAWKTPLHLAAAIPWNNPSGSQTVSVLLDFGARCDVRDRYGNTPLHLAVEAGNLESIEILLAHGADPFQPNSMGEAPLDRALLRRHPAIGERMLELVGRIEGVEEMVSK